MKSNELRIGNWVLSQDRDDPYFYQVARVETTEYTDWNSGEEYNVVGKIEGSVGGYYDIKPSPIPLTEEWLVKFGAMPKGNGIFNYNVGNGYIQIKVWGSGKVSYSIVVKSHSSCISMLKDIDYVHTFQNLIHALTGQELTIKEQ